MNKASTITFNQSEISSYLKDLRKIKVMTPEREKYLASLLQSPDITKDEKNSIKKEMIEGNLRFVITVAKQYQNQGLDFPDLIAEGNYGLAKAFDYFDWYKNTRFISYAVWWIRQSILQSLNENARTIRLPVNLIQEIQKCKKEINDFDSDKSDKFSNLPHTVDLDSPINDENDTILDLITNPNAESTDHLLNEDDHLSSKLMDILNSLDEREKIIIGDYYGLTGPCRTLEDIGYDFGLTKERVRQIKQSALRKLKNRSAVLFEYL